MRSRLSTFSVGFLFVFVRFGDMEDIVYRMWPDFSISNRWFRVILSNLQQ